MTVQRPLPLELAIGVVGPQELVERIMLSGPVMLADPPAAATASWPPESSPTGPAMSRRLVAAAYRNEQEAPDKVLRLGPRVDVFLFASQVPHEYARRAGVLRVPATCVPLAGSALIATLLRARAEARYQLSRVSVDVLARTDAEEAFAELGIPAASVQVREDPASPAVLAAFHERLWRRDPGSVAFTCLESVAQRLAAAQVPVYLIRPTGSAIRAALRTATLLGAHRRLEEAQLAVTVVDVPTLRDTARRSASRQSREELRLTVHRFLLREAQRMQATVCPVGDHTFLVIATRGSLSSATDGFRAPPFAERARGELGIVVEVGPAWAGPPRRPRRTRAPPSPARTPAWAAVGSPSTGTGRHWPPRRASPPPRAGRGAWRRCPGWPADSPTATTLRWWTPRPPVGCWASLPAPPAGCCIPWWTRAWPGRYRRTGPRSRDGPASSTGWSPRSWTAVRPDRPRPS